MNCLVTGGAGFIGSHLSEYLVSQGHTVVAIDNLSTGKITNLKAIIRHPNFKFIELDLGRDKFDSLNFIKFDWIFHLSANVGVERVVDDVNVTVANNLIATHNIVNFARANKTPVLFTSTSEIYGKSKKIPMSENDDRLMGAASISRWAYAETKVLDELLISELWKKDGIPTLIVRLFNTVGPRQSHLYGMVLAKFVYQARRNQPITVYGDGSQTRTFCHVNDVIRAIQGLIDCPSAYGEVFNIGGKERITIKELAEYVIYLGSSKSAITNINPKKILGEGFDEIPDRVPDTTKVESAIQWAPKIMLNEIVTELLQLNEKY